ALKVDPTDYQVLMNLGFIEIHKNNAAAAHGLFKKALYRPANVDSVYKARTLFAIARLHYAEQVYKNASSHAEQALKLNAVNDAADIFRAGVYAALAAETSLAIKRIEEAIILNPALFAIAAVEPDLQPIRKDVLALLSNISIAAKNRAAQVLLEVRKDLSASVTHEEHKLYSDLISMAENHLIKAETLLHKPSYSDCLDGLKNLEILRDVTREIGALPNLYATRQQLEKQLNEAEKRHSKCEAEKKSVPDVTSPEGTYYDASGPLGKFWWFYLFLWPVLTAWDWPFVGKGPEVRAILSGLILAAIGIGVEAIRRTTNNTRYNAQKVQYNKAQQRLKQTSDELVKLSTEISRTRTSLGGVDHEISGYLHRITQKINKLNWK
ncbi:MAG: hypothetical protein MN733_31280, partial [Nitrososphaera sp.]|nr:hypothetical protein [Nitrososphaera sp.]